MDERSSSDDASTVRGSLVDSRRLLFEKYVTEQANRPEGPDEVVAVTRRNGRLPLSVRSSKVNSFRDEAVPVNRVDARQSSPTESAKATVVGRRSHSDGDFVTDTQKGTGERTSPVPSPAASANADQSPPSLPKSPVSLDVAPSLATSETGSSSGESVSLVPRNECHSPEGALLSAGGSPEPTALCQSSADVSPPNCSKRVSYHHAVLNGAKLKLAETCCTSDALLETPCLNSSPSNGEGGSDHLDRQNLPDTLNIRDCESLTSSATHAASKRALPVEDLSASTKNCHNSSNSSSRERCEPVVTETTSEEPAPIDDGKNPVPATINNEIAPVADSDSIPGSADVDKTNFSAISNCLAESGASNESTLPIVPIVARKLTKPAVDSKPARSVIEKKPIYSSSHVPVAVPATVTANYPEDLNPFGDDDDDDFKNDGSRKSPEMSRQVVGSKHDSTNPFGSDSDDDDQSKSNPTAPSTNPFWSGSDEEDEDDSGGSAPRTPIPLPRTRAITSSSPHPSPRPRPRIATGYSSNEISPASSCRRSSADSADHSFNRSSNSINVTPRKKKPAPPPPPLKNDANHLVSKDEQMKNSNNEQTKIIDSPKANLDDSNVSLTDLKEDAHKKVVSQWKYKKRPAPARPTPLRRPVKEMPLEDIKVELEDIEIRYQELVRQTAQLEEKIHIKTELESAESSAVEEMVVQLFELVNEKNELFRRRSELVNMRKMHSLEVEQADIEYQIRCLMLRPESNKTDSDKASEEALVKRLVEVVEKRNEIIDLMDKDRLRETVEDESVTTQLEPKLKKDHRSKEKKKKNKKEKNKESDDSDKHSPSKLIKQKFMTLRHTAKKLHPKLPD